MSTLNPCVVATTISYTSKLIDPISSDKSLDNSDTYDEFKTPLKNCNTSFNQFENQPDLFTSDSFVEDYESTFITQRYRKHASLIIARHRAHATEWSKSLDAFKMSRCADEITYSKQDGTSAPRFRCGNTKTCPTCASIRQNEVTTETVNGINQLGYTFKDDAPAALDNNRKMICLKIGNMNAGEAVHISELESRIDILHKLWPRLINIKALKESFIGAMRGTEITYSGLNKAHPHMHGLILLRADYDYEKAVEAINKQWRRSLKSELRKITTRGEELPKISHCIDNIVELSQHTLKDFKSWVHYISKSTFRLDGKPETKAGHIKKLNEQLDQFKQPLTDFWLTLDDALKNKRMISRLGKEFTQAIKDGKVKSDHLNTDEAVEKQSTHKWSDKEHDYISIDRWTPEHRNPHFLTQSHSYARYNPQIMRLWKHERESIENEQLNFDLERSLNPLSVHNSYINYNKRELLLNNNKLSKEHWQEPSDSARSTLKKGVKND